MSNKEQEHRPGAAVAALVAGTAAMNAERQKREEQRAAMTPEGIARRFYYAPENRCAYLKDTGTLFLPLTAEGCKRHAEKLGLDVKEADDVRTFFHEVERRHYVRRAFDTLAGLPYGYYAEGFTRAADGDNGGYLVRNSAPWIEGRQGDCPVSLAFLRGMLDDVATPDQWPSFMACLQGARARIRAFREGGSGAIRERVQFLSIAGPPNVGKTFLVKKLVAPLLATPPDGMFAGEKFFTDDGGKGFNGGLERVPLILLDDIMRNVSLRGRSNIMSKWKGVGYSGAVAIEAKGRDSWTMQGPWCVVQLLNMDDESLSAFPLVGGDDDKLCGFLAGAFHPDLPPPNETAEDRAAVDEALAAEREALAWYVDNFPVPEHLKDDRGRHRCRAFVHPVLSGAVSVISPEMQILELIDAAARRAQKSGSGGDWGGIYREKTTATVLFDAVCGWLPDDEERRFKRFASDRSRLGRRLVAIARVFPGRVEVVASGNNKLYTIFNPGMGGM